MLCTVRLFTKVTKQSSTISGRFLMVLCHSASSALCPTMQISILLAYHFITWKIAIFCHFFRFKTFHKVKLVLFFKNKFVIYIQWKDCILILTIWHWKYRPFNLHPILSHNISRQNSLHCTWNLKLETWNGDTKCKWNSTISPTRK